MRGLHSAVNIIGRNITHRLHPIRQRNDNDANILRHGEQHLAQCLHLRATIRNIGGGRSKRTDAAHARNAFYEVSHMMIESRVQLLLISIQINWNRMQDARQKCIGVDS